MSSMLALGLEGFLSKVDAVAPPPATVEAVAKAFASQGLTTASSLPGAEYDDVAAALPTLGEGSTKAVPVAVKAFVRRALALAIVTNLQLD